MNEKFSAHEVFAAETKGGMENYARGFGMTTKEMQELIADKVVMDLGSGPGTFAAENELNRNKIGITPAKRVDSVNVRYAAADYQKFRQETGVPKIDSQNPVSKKLFGDKEKAAWEAAEKNFKGVDWNDMSSIPNESYDLIVSHNGFPHYSEMSVKTTIASVDDYQREKQLGAVIEFTDAERNVFGQLADKLKTGGEMYLSTNFPSHAWKDSPLVQAEMAKLFAEKGCEVELVEKTLEGPVKGSRTGDNYLRAKKASLSLPK